MMAVKGSFSARHNARIDMALRVERRKRQWWAYHKEVAPARAVHKLGPLSEGSCQDGQPKEERKGISKRDDLMEESHRYRLLKPLPLNTGSSYNGGAGGGGGGGGGMAAGEQQQHDPKVAAYYRGMSKHLDLLSLPAPGDRFQLVKVVGEGTYGEVYAARDKLTDRLVAVKIMENIADNVEEMEEEHRVLRDLCVHPNIPTYFGIFFQTAPCREDDQVWFVMELCTGGSVTDLVQNLRKSGGRLPEPIIAYILRETIDALRFLHAHHCMHRDVKGHNILLTDTGTVKLVDFGVSSHLDETMGKRNTSVGTPYWMAPEVVACERQLDYSYDIRCDVWSLGITAIELAEGEPPLADVHPMRALFQIPRNPPPKLKEATEWSDDFNDFLSVCLVKDYEKRPLMSDLMNHKFIAQVPRHPEEIRQELMRILKAQRKVGYSKRLPEVTTKHGQLKTDRKSRPTPILMDDLSALETLTEEIIVDQLYQRFMRGQIYTYIGDILLAMNPFQKLPIYSEEVSQRYRNRAKLDNPPHIFAVADAAYHSMLHQKRNQCIVISGESGAGKTESANLLLRQLVALGKATNRNLEDKILQVNPIMEAFGNAKTGINDNSSRFGKFLDLTFTEQGKITGGKLSVYLLEQSRVVWQSPQERNFHIFYYLYDGLADIRQLGNYYLDTTGKRQHRYLNGAASDKETASMHVDRLNNIKQGFQLLGFRSAETDTIYRILAAIVHLGDVEVRTAETTFQNDTCIIVNAEKIPIVAQLLGLQGNALRDALTSSSMVMRGEVITRCNSAQEAESARDAMAKALYARLFDWIVNQINRHLALGRIAIGLPLSVALLDIFGFEDLQKNSLEQLCINIANEQIQFFFNQHVFAWEQQEYLNEGLSVQPVSFGDNRPVLDMFLGRPLGLLALLDEESHFPKATDQTLIDKFHNNIRSKYYIRPKSNALQFTIRHHAGKVVYDARCFVEKNRNFLPTEIVQLLRQSKLPVVQILFQSPLTKTGQLYTPSQYACQNLSTQSLVSQAKALQTLSTSFRFSLMDLLQKMSAGLPHFVRCLKPNDYRLAAGFSRDKVLCQLRYTGVLETIYIRQQGFSHRYSFAELLKRYGFLAFSFNERVIPNRETCHLLLVRLKMDDYAIGKSKVFLKYYHVEYLSRLYEQQIRKIVIAQSAVRRWLAKRHTQKRRLAIALVAQRCQMKIQRNKEAANRRKAASKAADPNGSTWKCLKILDFCQKVHHCPSSRNRCLKKVHPSNNLTHLIMTCHQVSNLSPRSVQAIVDQAPIPSERRINGRCKNQDHQHQQRPQPKKSLHLNNFELCTHKLSAEDRPQLVMEPPVKPAPRELRSKVNGISVDLKRQQEIDANSASANSSSSSSGPRPTMVEVESWWQEGPPKENQTTDPAPPPHTEPLKAQESDPNQGPYQFKKILRKPPPSPKPSPNRQTPPGMFDFRKLLRKTDHAPTETLKRCKGLISPPTSVT